MLIVIRHGAVSERYRGTWLGRTDVPLDPQAEGPLISLVPFLSRLSPLSIFTSPLKRAVSSADVLASSLGVTPEVAPELSEMDLGAWRGHRPDEIRRMDPARWRAYLDDTVGVAPPGGEPYRAMAERVYAFVDKRLAEAASESTEEAVRSLAAGPPPSRPTVLLITHTGPLLALACRALDLPLDRRIHLAPPHASATGLLLRTPELLFFGQVGSIPTQRTASP